jgi:hypothetical protein
VKANKRGRKKKSPLPRGLAASREGGDGGKTMASKTTAIRSVSVLAASGLNGKTITDVIVTQHGSVTAVEVVFSGGSQFIKERQGVIDVGGTLDFGTGTLA